MERKDSLTDLIEAADQAKPPVTAPNPSEPRRVVNPAGETIILEPNPSKVITKGFPLELLRAGILKAVADGVERGLKNLLQKK